MLSAKIGERRKQVRARYNLRLQMTTANIPQKCNFDLGYYPTVSECKVSAFRLGTTRLYHVLFCLQSQQYIVQQEFVQKWSYVR